MKLPGLFQAPKTAEEILKFLKFELFFLGCWTSEKNNRAVTYVRWFIHFFVNTTNDIGQYAFAYASRGDLPLILDVICPATTMGVTSFKIWMLWWRTKELNGIFETIQESIGKEIQEKGTWARKWIPLTGFYFTIFLSMMTNFTGTSFCLGQLISNIQHKIKGEDFVPQLPFKSSWPFEFQKTPIYELMFIYSWYGGVVTQFGIPGCDSLFLDLYLHIGVLFKAVSYDLQNIVKDIIGDDDESVQKFTPDQNRKVYKKLRLIMQKHQFSLDLCDRVLKFFREIVFIHIASASLIICLSSINIILAKGANKLIYINYIIAATTQVFIYAMAGTHLEEKCGNVATAAYEMPWYKMDGRTRGLVLMMILRGQKPKTIKALMVSCSLPAFTAICQAAGSYVTLLQTFL